MVIGIVCTFLGIGALMYALVYSAASNRSKEYQAWLDDEQAEAIRSEKTKN